ncbi:Rieske (2Fe-2S) protein [Aquabacter spiritensis]|uniref:Nitrite reductase/ring-hydroxylating ferredoxin subunit n=1 Tax=Aquabacter spiritensis TaxID=933073 RepID=A0A4R3M4U2_9HYPH|nr:Rieske 2Fe-2S domain-containing protein [Aquabacter spiritensis]TCT07876.1 nitrite reductase/ring-hydroxylating ferredoxin subunit [Aquabacter spiritensis]
MTSGQTEVFVICATRDIAPGQAKAFSLARLEADGAARPFAIVIARNLTNDYFGYSNICPHNKTWLNIGNGDFFTPDGAFLRCSRHGATFEIDTGLCVAGPCAGQSLEPLTLVVVEGDVCICGIALLEDDGLPDPFVDLDDTMEIMIHPD